jgi:SAM-dependent methyltransferase
MKKTINIVDKKFHDDMVKHGSFPKGERDQPYQEYYYKTWWVPCERSIVDRASLMGYNPKEGETVLEIGCQTGGFLQLAWLNGARNLVGVDYDGDYIRLAKELNRINSMNVDYLQGSAMDNSFLADLKARLPKVDHLLLMSMEKHIGTDQLFRIVDLFGAKRTYIETNALKPGQPPSYAKKLEEYGARLVATTTDRNRREVYLIETQK